MLSNVRHRSRFPTTDWNLVVATRQPKSTTHGAAAELCSAYWYPVYAYLRRRGHRVDEAEDLTQGFFAHVIAHRLLERAQPDKGRLRSFLLASLANYIANDRHQSYAQKRGGPRSPWLPLDDAEPRYRLEPADDTTPERIYERQWAVTLLERVLKHLRAELVRADKQQLFDVLKPHLAGDTRDALYRHAAETLGISEGAARVAAHRLRRRYRDLLRAEIQRTVSGRSEDVDDEIRYLFSVTRHRASAEPSWRA